MPPIIWTSKWRMLIVRRLTSRTSAKVSGSRSSTGSPPARALAQRVGVGAQLVVVEQLELGLPGVDPVDALGVLLELPGFAHAQGTIEDRHSYLA